jgi:FkbM family methyltransferase
MKYFLRRKLPKIRGLRKILPEILFYKKKINDEDRLILDKINKYNIKLWYYFDHPTYRNNFYNRLNFEEKEIELIHKIIKNDWLIFDIGASVGYYSILFSKLANNGQIFSFEPARKNYDILRMNIKENNCQNILPQNLAIGDKVASANLLIFEDYAYNSLINTNRQKLIGQEKVNVTTIDEFVSVNKIKKLNFIKIDAEGYEYNILKGGLDSISFFKPLILCEICQSNLTSVGLKPDYVVEKFIKIGYEVFSINKSEIKKIKNIQDIGSDYNFFFKPF